MTVLENDDLFIASKNGKLSRTSVAEIPVLGRQAAGVLTMGLADDDIVVSISKNTGEEESEAEDANV
jgi:DNA gyrase/topoisomerase IV subunit A